MCVCVCVCVCKEQKTDKNTGRCCEKEMVTTTMSSYNVQTTMLLINYRETKSSITANTCKDRLAKTKNIYYYIVWATQRPNSNQK